jgi:hypothetical protein
MTAETIRPPLWRQGTTRPPTSPGPVFRVSLLPQVKRSLLRWAAKDAMHPALRNPLDREPNVRRATRRRASSGDGCFEGLEGEKGGDRLQTFCEVFESGSATEYQLLAVRAERFCGHYRGGVSMRDRATRRPLGGRPKHCWAFETVPIAAVKDALRRPTAVLDRRSSDSTPHRRCCVRRRQMSPLFVQSS